MVLLFVAGAALLLLWQARAGPAAQLLAVPGAVALGWMLVPRFQGSKSALVRVFGTFAVILLIGSGLFAGLAIRFLPIDRPDKRTQIVDKASGYCPTMTALAPLDRYPKATIFSFVDLGPRIITITHHNAVARAVSPQWRRDPRRTACLFGHAGEFPRDRQTPRRDAMLLVCPNMAESTIYRVRAPGGFYDQLAHRKEFDFLEPLPMPKGSPLRLWRIKP